MSRTPGRVQRFAMEAMDANPRGVHVVDVARDLYDLPSEAEYESVRRALASLARRGLAERHSSRLRTARGPWYANVGSLAVGDRPNTYRRVLR